MQSIIVQDRPDTYIKDGSGSELAVYYSGYAGFEYHVIMKAGATCIGRLKSFKKFIVHIVHRPKLIDASIGFCED